MRPGGAAFRSAGGRRGHKTPEETDRPDLEPTLALEPEQADEVASGLHRLLEESLAFSAADRPRRPRRGRSSPPPPEPEDLSAVRMFCSVPEGEPCVLGGRGTGRSTREDGPKDDTLASGRKAEEQRCAVEVAPAAVRRAESPEKAGDSSCGSDSSSDSDDAEEAARMAALASCAVSGASITASARKSAKAAARALQGPGLPAAGGPQPTAEAMAMLEASGEQPGAHGPGAIGSGGSYLSLADTRPEEDKPLEGALAVKLTGQLHSIVARGLEPRVGGSSDSASISGSDVSGDGGSDEEEEEEATTPAGAVVDNEHTAETCSFVRMFRQVRDGDPCLLTRPAGPTQPQRWPSWASALDDEVGGSSSDEEEALRSAKTVAEEPERIWQRAARLAEKASAHVAEVIREVNSDDDGWRGGVKPGSSIERRGGAHKGTTHQPGGPAESEGAKQKRKRKGKKERQREAAAVKTPAEVDAVEGAGKEKAAGEGAAVTGQADAAGDEGAETEDAKLERKRAKRREIKKRRKQQQGGTVATAPQATAPGSA